MSRADRDPVERAQLDALDRILAREPVGEEHLELAALVDSVRGDAPRMDPEFAGRLDARTRERLARRSRRPRMPALGLRRLSLAGGGLVAAAVAFTIVMTSGVLDTGGGRTTVNGLSPSHRPDTFAAKTPTSTRHAGPVAGASTKPAPSAAGGTRLVHRSSALTLATPASSLPRVAARVVAVTERHGGVVASSYVVAHGAASHATFSLRVPSANLPTLIVGLSSLATVRALTQNTSDVTEGYQRESQLLAQRLAARARLERRLPDATGAADAAAIRRRIQGLDRRIAAERRAAAALLAQAQTAVLHVGVVVGANANGAAAGGGGGPLGGAGRTALHALEQLLAIALVAIAVALPIALCALAMWWGASSLRHRSRERALRAA